MKEAANRGGLASKSFQLPYGKVAPVNLSMIYRARFEDKDPFAVIELGAATERSIQKGTYGVGPSASVEFPVIKDWLEIETGISPLFRPGQTEWQADLLFKRPCWAIFRPNRDHGQTFSSRRRLRLAKP